MKIKIKLIFTTIFFAFSSVICSQEKSIKSFIYATTENGEVVKLYSDGTWEKHNALNEIPDLKNLKKYIVPKEADSIYKNDSFNYTIHYNKSNWKIIETKLNQFANSNFLSSNNQCVFLIIAENSKMSLTTLKNAVLNNARNISPNISVIKSEYRMVNNKLFLFIELLGSIKGVPYRYYYYLFSGKNKILQFSTASTGPNFENNKSIMMNILNGIVIEND